MTSSSASTFANRLANEKSAYLLQHAHNPVDWYSWNSEAFEKAKRENKPIFLSVGYSTCHWCHVMEHESFESPEIAAFLNEHFVNIKIDREERPDIDKQYMSFVQATTGHGGWPMSIWLTPDLKGVMAGTYFPPDDNYGRPGFKSVIHKFAQMWRSSRGKLEEQAKYLTDALGSSSLDMLQGSELPPNDAPKRLAGAFERRYDSEYGGFSSAPKFPQPGIITFLLHYHISAKLSGEPNYGSAESALATLEKMARGGIHDHIGKGFHRYSTDNMWHVPHFEKMLYDQAQLSVSYAEAFMLTKDQKFARILDGIITYMLRDLHHPSGGFYSAEDADSYPAGEKPVKKMEGAFYAWKYDEIGNALKDETVTSDFSSMKLSELFCKVFDVRPEGNVASSQDPHGELKAQNVLIQRKSLADYSKELNIPEDKLLAEIDRACEILAEARNQRPRPHRDEKFVTAWNGMALSGLSYAAMALQRPDLIETAVKTANFIHTHLFNEASRRLWRTCYAEGNDNNNKEITQLAEPIEAVCIDYCCLIAGLLDLYEATLDVSWLTWAAQLQETQNVLFWDDTPDRLSYFASHNSQLVFKIKDEQDGAEPGSNSLSCMNLLRLADYLGRDNYRQMAEGILQTYSQLISEMAAAVPSLMAAFLRYKSDCRRYVICGESQAVLTTINSHFDPFRSIYRVEEDFFAKKLPWLDELRDKQKQRGFVGVVVSDLKGLKDLKNTDEVDSFLRDFDS